MRRVVDERTAKPIPTLPLLVPSSPGAVEMAAGGAHQRTVGVAQIDRGVGVDRAWRDGGAPSAAGTGPFRFAALPESVPCGPWTATVTTATKVSAAARLVSHATGGSVDEMSACDPDCPADDSGCDGEAGDLQAHPTGRSRWLAAHQ